MSADHRPRRRPLVVKVGGGLLRAAGLDGLRRACVEVSALAAGRPVLVVPGGGPFADAVRELDARCGLGDEVAHELALGAMDQLGVVLGVLLGELVGESEWLERLAVPRTVAILRAQPAFAGVAEVPRSWTVTSDSLAVLAAGRIGAGQAILLKPVAGVFARWPADGPPLPALTATELRALQDRGGGRAVDVYLAEAVTRTGVTAIVRGLGAGAGPGGGPGPGAGVPAAGTRITPD